MSKSEFIWRLQILLVLGLFIEQSLCLNIKIKSTQSEIQDREGAETSRKFGQINIHGPPPGQSLSHGLSNALNHVLESKPSLPSFHHKHKRPFLHHPVHYHGVQNVDYNAGQPVQFWYQWALALALPIIVVPLISILFIQLIQENQSQSSKSPMQSLGGLAGPHGQGLGSSPVEQHVSPVMSPEQSQMYGAPQHQQQQQQQQQQQSVPQQQYGIPINRSDQEKYNKLTKNVMDSITTVKNTLKNKKVNDNKLSSILANL